VCIDRRLSVCPSVRPSQVDYVQGRPKNRGHFVLWLITLEILNRFLPNLAQTKVTSF